VRRAIEIDAEAVEADVQRCADGTLVLVHDLTLTRTTDAAKVYPD
jgi:glycerophosphoryl diester phosphodiesterase